MLFKRNSKTGCWMSKNYVIYESQLIKIKVSEGYYNSLKQLNATLLNLDYQELNR